jgi:hypothetical protein
MRNYENSRYTSYLEERASLIRMIRTANPSAALNNTHDYFILGLLKNARFNVRLGNFTIGAPILASSWIRNSSENADNVFLFSTNLCKSLIELGRVGNFDNSRHFL